MKKFPYATWASLVAAAVVLFSAPICAANDDSDPLGDASSLRNQANLAEEREARVLVKKALALQTQVRPHQVDRHKGSAEAEKLLRDFRAENPLYLQALLYQGRHHHWKAVEGNYQRGIEISKKIPGSDLP